jgi:glycosyltransferase involved in cell wall biosynthesis
MPSIFYKITTKARHIRLRLANIDQRWAELYQRWAELNLRKDELDLLQDELAIRKLKYGELAGDSNPPIRNSFDRTPWLHPYLSEINIKRFREYSEAVWEIAMEYASQNAKSLKTGFVVNMNQNMYKWAKLAEENGAQSVLFLNPMDHTALNRPEWEEFDGESSNPMDATMFLRKNPNLKAKVPCLSVPMDGSQLLQAFTDFTWEDRRPLARLMAQSKGMRHEVLLGYAGFYPYYEWAKSLTEFDVLYTTGPAVAAYASGRPYCVFSFGGDLIFDAGRGDAYGEATLLSYNAARFLFLSNPHTLAYSRRLGLTNAVYLPYPMDDNRYSPGVGQARKSWETEYGKGVYVLMTSRLDAEYKGQDDAFFNALKRAAKERPVLRFVFLAWGENASDFQAKIRNSGLQEQFIILDPVGKQKLIDYYRSCDIVLDSFAFGYYGVTALEAASIGKPVIMKLRMEHYAPLYRDDVMPVFNAATPDEIVAALLLLCDDNALRLRIGNKMRQWLVRTHGEKRTVPLMLALLRLAANRVPLPDDLIHPLLDLETEEEKEYHESCIQSLI